MFVLGSSWVLSGTGTSAAQSVRASATSRLRKNVPVPCAFVRCAFVCAKFRVRSLRVGVSQRAHDAFVKLGLRASSGMPTPDHHEIVFRINPNRIAAPALR